MDAVAVVDRVDDVAGVRVRYDHVEIEYAIEVTVGPDPRIDPMPLGVSSGSKPKSGG